MRVSVIIPNYNYGSFIAGTIQSVLNQSDTVDEIIVVDDGSTDHSREVISSFGSKIQPVFQENKGQAAAISTGFSRATGDIIFLLDSDDFFMPDKCRIIKKIYEDNKNVQWVFHSLQQIESKTIPELSSMDIAPAAISRIDQRQSLKEGQSGYAAPATSGLSFRADFLKDLFPLPAAESIYISDHYIKFYCLAMGIGLHIAENLGGQLIHGDNLYTGQKQMVTKGKIFVNTAYALRKICPEIERFCTSLFVEGRACANATGSSETLKSVIDLYQEDMSPFALFLIEFKTLIKTRRYQKLWADC